jgi:hypothetical protein
MKRPYTLFQQFIPSILIVSLFLQNCGGSSNLPLQGEEDLSSTSTIEQEEGQKQRRRKRARIEVGAVQEQSLIAQAQGVSSFDMGWRHEREYKVR